VRYGFYLPNTTRDRILALAREGARLGLHSAMIADHTSLPGGEPVHVFVRVEGKHPGAGDALETLDEVVCENRVVSERPHVPHADSREEPATGRIADRVRKQVARHRFQQTRIAVHCHPASDHAPARSFLEASQANSPSSRSMTGKGELRVNGSGFELLHVVQRIEHAGHAAERFPRPAEQRQCILVRVSFWR